MHPYVLEKMVKERHEELLRLRAVDRAWPVSVPRWRMRAGRAFGSLAVALAVPRAERTTTRRQVGAALCMEPPC